MTVRNVDASTVCQLTCPIIAGMVEVGNPAPGETIVFPRQGEGYIFKNPYPVVDRLPLRVGSGPDVADVGVGELHGLYPGCIGLQMCAYYDQSAGLYLATHDSGQHAKTLDIAPVDGLGSDPVFSITHITTEAADEDVGFAYPTVIGSFHGDWYDAADLYKSWATQQWWCDSKLAERDIPPWMRTGFGTFQMSNYSIPKLNQNHTLSDIANTVNDVSENLDVPLLALIFNWEGQGGWTGPCGMFPPRDGESAFKDAMRELQSRGNLGLVYMAGGCWYLELPYDTPFNSWAEFEAEGRANAILMADGQITDLGPKAPGWKSTRICPATPYTHEITKSIVMKCLNLGCAMVQIDNLPCGGAEPCHNPAHGHPIGQGAWWAEAWCNILADIRRSAKEKHPGCALSTEGITEGFIPFLDLYDQRCGNMEYWGGDHFLRGDPMHGEVIPLFGYVYHEYVGAYSAAYPDCNRPEVLYWTRALGKALAHGVIPTTGKYFPTPAELNPITLGFFQKIITVAARECWPYVMFGEMLRRPPITVPMMTASYCRMTPDNGSVDTGNRHEINDVAVEHSVWRGPDGSIAYLFVNVSEEAVSFDVKLSAHDLDGPTFDITWSRDVNVETSFHSTQLPRAESVEIPPLSIVLAKITSARRKREAHEYA